MLPAAATAPGRPHSPAVVVHPETVDLPAFRLAVEQRFRDAGWPAPVWGTTTPQDPGTLRAREVLAGGADLVVACGGDGTVRAVAEALAWTGVPLAVVPTGTGNLLARNVGIPLDVQAALEVVTTGADRPLDLGRVEGGCFAVMAGMGLDAAMVRDAPPGLKLRLGWPAYVVSGLRHLLDARMELELRVDDDRPVVRRARAVVVGNVGELQGGLRLLPDADPADGLLDLAVIAPRSVLDWVRVAGRLLRRGARNDGRLERRQFRRLEIRTSLPQPYELDGDAAGSTTSLVVEVRPGALVLRVPR